MIGPLKVEVMVTGIYYAWWDLFNLNLASAYETNNISVLKMKEKFMMFRHPLRGIYPGLYCYSERELDSNSVSKPQHCLFHNTSSFESHTKRWRQRWNRLKGESLISGFYALLLVTEQRKAQVIVTAMERQTFSHRKTFWHREYTRISKSTLETFECSKGTETKAKVLKIQNVSKKGKEKPTIVILSSIHTITTTIKCLWINLTQWPKTTMFI